MCLGEATQPFYTLAKRIKAKRRKFISTRECNKEAVRQNSSVYRFPVGWHVGRSPAPRHLSGKEDTGDRLLCLGSPSPAGRLGLHGWLGERQGRDFLQHIVGSCFGCPRATSLHTDNSRNIFRHKVFCSQNIFNGMLAFKNQEEQMKCRTWL